MLTPPSNNAERSSPTSASNLSCAFGAAQLQSQQFNNSATDHDDHQRQEALASLFRSLSSLANSQQKQLHYGNNHGPPVSAIDGCQQGFLTSANGLFATSNQCGPQTHLQPPPPPPPPVALPATTSNDSISNSIQSVVAAAVMQHQLVSAALNHHNHQYHHHHQQQQQPPPPTQPSPPMAHPAHMQPQAKFQAQPLMQQPPPPQTPVRAPNPTMIRPTGAPSFMTEQQLRTNIFPPLAGQGQQPNQTFSGLEHDLQYVSAMNLTEHQLQQSKQQQQKQQQHQQHQQQNAPMPQQQRINYCTICNKELCNKYFMKTHMLKMHGISLEMEQTGESEGVECDRSSGSEQDGAQKADSSNDDRQSPEEKKFTPTCSSSSSSSHATNLSNQQSKQNDKQTAAKKSTGSPGGGGGSKQATSVMNGFAGNSMGGVVCDICNKELCSKYFLKVHKQNTHGIMTDYQDASQFVYTFANPLSAPNPFITPLSMGPLGLPTSGSSIYSSPASFYDQATYGSPMKNLNQSGEHISSKRPKKARLTKGGAKSGREERSGDSAGTASADSSTQMDAVYRLMMAQQPDLQQPPMRQQQAQPLTPFDPRVANSMSALMCFGAMGPFGPAGLSPTMIVEMILRNQHLFNRNNLQNNQQQSAQRTSRQTGKDRNNNDSKHKTGGGGKNSKEANNSRYFTHYTEACPMCDRRFKSIKWLKTHMMNDHKQEIGTYIQMMMQQLYTSKTCPVAAPLGTPMPLEQQQQPMQQQPSTCFPININTCNSQPQQQPLLPASQQNFLSLSNQITPTSTSYSQTVNFQSRIQRQPQQKAPQQRQNGEQSNSIRDYLSQKKLMVEQKLLDFSNAASRQAATLNSPPSMNVQNLVIDARCKRESLSPANSGGDCNHFDGEQPLDDRLLVEHLDLSANFIRDGEQLSNADDDGVDDDDFATRAQTLIRNNRMEEASSFLLDDNNNNNSNNNNNNNDDDDDDEEEEDGQDGEGRAVCGEASGMKEDDDCLSHSSYRDEQDQPALHADLNAAGPSTEQQPRHIIKTKTTS